MSFQSVCVNHKETTMTISVIIPSYKPGEYINDCLKSIKEQSLSESEYEVIIILNGCCEPYLEMLTSVKKILFHNSDNVHIIQTDIPGVSNARNLGIEAAKGEYLTFVDDDDIVSPTYLASLLEVSTPTCVGCANSYAFENDISEYKSNFLSKAFVKCKGKPFTLLGFRQFLSPPWAKLIHKDIVVDARFPVSLRKSEDSIFCMLLTPRIKKMQLADESAIYYQRRRPESVMRTKNSVLNEMRLFIKIEFEYIKMWFKSPLRYNIILVLLRMLVCVRNTWVYIYK